MQRPPPDQFAPHTIRFSDSSNFDMMLETALVSNRPSIVIQTDATSIDELDSRVGEWVSAWLDGGKFDVPNSRGLGTSQAIMLGLEIANSEEFDKFLKEVKNDIKTVAVWYGDTKTKQKRTDLLRPYVLAFEESGEDGKIVIHLYNGNYNQFEPSVPAENHVSQFESSHPTATRLE